MFGRYSSRRLSVLIILAGIAPLSLKPQTASDHSISGQQIFNSSCSSCHGLDGRGGEHAPNIATNPEIQSLTDKRIVQIVRNGIPAAGMPAFRYFKDAQVSAVVKYLRGLQGRGVIAPPISGDPERGRLLFFGRARCSECHMVNGRGGFLGANLSGYGKVHSPASIREWILDPNKNLDPRHGFAVVTTKACRKYSGVIRNEDNFSLQMQNLDGNFHLFDKSELTRIDRKLTSIMPSQYGSTMTPAEINDVISFLMQAPGTQTSEAQKEEE
ncbi:MAG TPA: c-type cytochrome [Bryobacteraceae bacterium]